MPLLKMSDLDLTNKRVLIREDFNVPIANGEVTSDVRIRAALPTIQQALQAGAAVILLSHLGRPIEGECTEEFSLMPIAKQLTHLLGKPVPLIKNWLTGISVAPGEVVLCENVRVNQGEKRDDETLAQQMATLCDVFVMDAFGAAHRAEASTHGVAKFAPIACAGPLLVGELEALAKAMQNPAKPMLSIVGGSKVSTKLNVLESLINISDHLLVGGGIANTFIAASGASVGKSLYEPELVDEAKRLMTLAKQRGVTIPLPRDVVVAKQFAASESGRIKPITQVTANEMILDVGPQTSQEFAALIKNAATILWNGPVGVFEFPAFAAGTASLANAIAESAAFTIAGGGDTLAAIEKYRITDKISYISTGGGAFLEFVEGKKLPAVAILEERSKKVV